MPEPRPDEKYNDFIGRCMAFPEMLEKHPEEKNRFAVCQSFWDKKLTSEANGMQKIQLSQLSDEQIDGWWDIARVGGYDGFQGGKPKHIELTVDDLRQMAEDYDPGLLNAPLTVDHVHEGPAAGWIAALRLQGDILQAKFTDLADWFRKSLRTGAYRNRSAEFYQPLKSTGRTYLSALTFLGAKEPAVKGLAPQPSLFQAHGEPSIAVLFSNTQPAQKAPEKGVDEMDEKTIVAKVIEAVKNLFASGEVKIQAAAPDKTGEIDQLKSSLAESQKLCLAEKARADKAEAILAAQAETAALAEFKGKIEAAKTASRLTPAEASGYVTLGEKLDAAGRAVILEQVAARQDNKLLSELSAKKDSAVKAKTDKFKNLPEDPLHERAAAIMAEDSTLKFEAAVQRAIQENPELGKMPLKE